MVGERSMLPRPRIATDRRRVEQQAGAVSASPVTSASAKELSDECQRYYLWELRFQEGLSLPGG